MERFLTEGNEMVIGDILPEPEELVRARHQISPDARSDKAPRRGVLGGTLSEEPPERQLAIVTPL
ncbi:MAG: hypothetical protein M1299_07825 [Firmicutes bacterium]|nr:hypothetical protein [Bacillota bacterium]